MKSIMFEYDPAEDDINLSDVSEQAVQTFIRQITLMRLIPKRHPASTTELRKKLRERLPENMLPSNDNAYKKMFERDYKFLKSVSTSLQLDLVIDTGSKPHKLHWAESPGEDAWLGLSKAQALCMRLIEQNLTKVLPPHWLGQMQGYFSQASKVLEDEPWAFRLHWLHRRSPIPAPQVKDDHLKQIEQAMKSGHKLNIRARRFARGSAADLLVTPLALVSRDDVLFLAGEWAGKLAGSKVAGTIKLHRIENISVSLDKANIPANFSAEAFLAKHGLEDFGGEMIDLVVHFHGHVGDYLLERNLPASSLEDLGFDADGNPNGVVLRTRTLLCRQLRLWLHSLGSEVEILAPPVLREEFAEAHREAMQRYERAYTIKGN